MLANNFIKKSTLQNKIFFAFAALIMLFTSISILKENYLIAAMPIGILALMAIIKDYRFLYYGFWVALPFSVEFYFGSIGMDLPTEPMMLGLTAIAIAIFLQKLGKISFHLSYY